MTTLTSTPTRPKQLAIAATYTSRTAALSVYDLLRAQGFEHTWLATTAPADATAVRPDVADKHSQNDITDSSEGVLGTIGRFFTGEGNSLRRSLEDHGVDPLDASQIDDELPPLGAVVTTFGDGRSELAAEIMRAGATHVYVPPEVPNDASFSAELADTSPGTSTIVSRELVDRIPVAGVPGAIEEVFIEHRVVITSGATGSTTIGSRSAGLNDLL